MKHLYKYYVADVYDSFGMYETRIITRHDLNVFGKTRKVVTVAGGDSYESLRKAYGL